jgi:hypothetical protein
MEFEVNGPFKASEVLTLHEDVAPGLPPFANLKAKRHPGTRGSEALKGPGIYGLFCKGSLYYIGIYTGAARKTFTGTVLDRWDMHLTYHSLRSPKIKFAPSSMLRILRELQGDAADTFATMLGGRDLSIDDLRSADVPFVGKGPSCTYNKALFASRNWDVFGPGNEERMLSDVTFAYARILPAAAARLGQAQGVSAYNWVKYNWLETRETRLVEALRPICNSVTDDYREDVGVDEFLKALKSELSRPFDHFVANHPPKTALSGLGRPPGLRQKLKGCEARTP